MLSPYANFQLIVRRRVAIKCQTETAELAATLLTQFIALVVVPPMTALFHNGEDEFGDFHELQESKKCHEYQLCFYELCFSVKVVCGEGSGKWGVGGREVGGGLGMERRVGAAGGLRKEKGV